MRYDPDIQNCPLNRKCPQLRVIMRKTGGVCVCVCVCVKIDMSSGQVDMQHDTATTASPIIWAMLRFVAV